MHLVIDLNLIHLVAVGLHRVTDSFDGSLVTEEIIDSNFLVLILLVCDHNNSSQ